MNYDKVVLVFIFYRLQSIRTEILIVRQNMEYRSQSLQGLRHLAR